VFLNGNLKKATKDSQGTETEKKIKEIIAGIGEYTWV